MAHCWSTRPNLSRTLVCPIARVHVLISHARWSVPLLEYTSQSLTRAGLSHCLSICPELSRVLDCPIAGVHILISYTRWSVPLLEYMSQCLMRAGLSHCSSTRPKPSLVVGSTYPPQNLSQNCFFSIFQEA